MAIKIRQTRVFTLEWTAPEEVRLDRVAAALGRRGINILSCHGLSTPKAGQWVLAVDQPEAASVVIADACRETAAEPAMLSMAG